MLALLSNGATATDNQLSLFGDIDAIIAGADADLQEFIEQNTSTASGMAQAVNKNKAPAANSCDVRGFVTKNYQKPQFGAKNGETDQRYGFQIAYVSRRAEGDSDKLSGPTGLTLQSDPSISWKKSKCPPDSTLEKAQHVFCHLDKLKQEREKKSGKSTGNKGAAKKGGDADVATKDEVFPILEAANLSTVVREECLPSCTYRATPSWAPNYRPPGAKEKEPVTDDKNTYYVESLSDDLLPKKAAEFLQERAVADSVVSLFHKFRASKFPVKYLPGELIDVKHRKGEAPLQRFGVVDFVSLHYGVMIDPQEPSYPDESGKSEMLWNNMVHKAVTFTTYDSHDILYPFGDPLMMEWRITKGDYAQRLPSFVSLLNNNKNASLTVRMTPMPVCDAMLSYPHGNTLGCDLIPGQAFNDAAIYATADRGKDNPAKICLRATLVGQQWEVPLTDGKSANSDGTTTFTLSSRANYLRVVMWSDLLAPMYALDPKDVECWKVFLAILMRSSEMLLTGVPNEQGTKALISSKRTLPRYMTASAATAFFTKHGQQPTPSDDADDALFQYPTLTCTERDDKATAVNMFKDGYGQEPVILELDIKSALFNFADTLRRYAIPVTKEAAQIIYNKWVATMPKPYTGAKCNNEDIQFLSNKTAAGQKSPVDLVDEGEYEFRLFSSQMTANDLTNLGKNAAAKGSPLKATDFSKAFTPAHLKLTDNSKRTEQLKKDGCEALANYGCLDPTRIPSAQYLIYAVKRITGNPADKMAADLRNIASYLTPSSVKTTTTTMTNNVSKSAAIAAAPLPDPIALKKARATIEDIDDDDDDDNSGGDDETKNNKKKRSRDSTEDDGADETSSSRAKLGEDDNDGANDASMQGEEAEAGEEDEDGGNDAAVAASNGDEVEASQMY